MTSVVSSSSCHSFCTTAEACTRPSSDLVLTGCNTFSQGSDGVFSHIGCTSGMACKRRYGLAYADTDRLKLGRSRQPILDSKWSRTYQKLTSTEKLAVCVQLTILWMPFQMSRWPRKIVPNILGIEVGPFLKHSQSLEQPFITLSRPREVMSNTDAIVRHRIRSPNAFS